VHLPAHENEEVHAHHWYQTVSGSRAKLCKKIALQPSAPLWQASAIAIHFGVQSRVAKLLLANQRTFFDQSPAEALSGGMNSVKNMNIPPIRQRHKALQR
jgi:hypothetical protein